MKYILICTLIVSSICISVPLTSNRQRCMVTYSVGQTQTMKLDMKFPEIPNAKSNEVYTVSWKNTENDDIVFERVVGGVFRKQLQLQLHVIYEVCFWFQSTRELQFIVQYSAHSLFNFKQEEVKVPDNLLKIDDIRNTFINAQELIKVTQQFKNIQKNRIKDQDKLFVETNQANESLITLSIIELIIIIAAGLYQFWSLRNFLIQKQWI